MTCSIQWWIVGYTLAYGDGGSIVGNFAHLFHRGVLAQPIGTIPALLFSQFQLVFEATVCAIAVGGFCERARLLPVVPFIFVRFVSTAAIESAMANICAALVDVYLLPSRTHGLGWGFSRGDPWGPRLRWR